jgi:hypothetical protein
MKFEVDITQVERTTVRHTVEADNHEEAVQLALDGEGNTEVIDVEVGEIDSATVNGPEVLNLTGMFGPFRKVRRTVL